MTENTLPLAELLAKAGDGDFLRCVAEAVVQLLMETDVEGLIGAGRHERSGERTTIATAPLSGRGTPGWAACGGTPPSRGRAAPSRRSWSRARRGSWPWWR